MKRLTAGSNSRFPEFRLLISWLLLCVAIALHVTDEATHGFLAVYNPTVEILRSRVPWLALPVFTFTVWIIGLSVAIVVLLFVSPLLSRGNRWIKRLAYVVAVLMVLNGVNHIVGTILGHTVTEVRYQRPMPGFYSSPTLIAASIYLLLQLKNAKQPRLRPQSGLRGVAPL